MQLFIEFPSWLHPEVIPGIPIPRWYSLAYLFGFGITYLLMRRDIRSGRLPYSEQDLSSFFVWCIVGTILGNRLIYVIFYDPNRAYLLSRPWLIYWPFNQGRFVGLTGLSYHGAVLGIAVAMLLFVWKKKQNLFRWADSAIAALPLGYTLGRLANFINGELYGRATTVPWAVRFPHAEKLPTSLPWVREMAAKNGIELDGLTVNLPRHPSQIYEAFFEGVVLWLLLYFVFRPQKKFTGKIAFCYLVGYGTVRFLIEYLRQPDAQLGYIIQAVPGDYRQFVSLANISMGQLLSLAMIVAGSIPLLILRKKKL